MSIRDLTRSDLDDAFQINEVGIDVDRLDRSTLATLYERSVVALAAIAPSSAMVGFCLVIDTRDGSLPPRSAWAMAHPEAELHIERIAFQPEGSGHGLGVEMFDVIDERVGSSARTQATDDVSLTSVLRVEPLNEHGWNFHVSRGFTEIDRRRFGDTSWALMQKRYPG